MQGKKTIALVGECYIFLHDLLKMRATVTNLNGKIKKSVQLQKVLWSDGHNVGNVVGEIIVEYEPFMQQLFAGVMTEHGLQRSAPLVMGTGSKKAEKSQEYIQLTELLNRLNTLNAATKPWTMRDSSTMTP